MPVRRPAAKPLASAKRTTARPGAHGRKPGRTQPAASRPLVVKLMDSAGTIAIDDVAQALRMSKGQFAETAGLKRETLYKVHRARAPKTQARVREMLEIIGRVSHWAGGEAQALAWYRAQPIPAFGGRTAEALVKSGQAAGVRDYLDHIAVGGFA